MQSRIEQIKEIFLASLEYPTDKRVGFLASMCADDSEIATEVKSLLDHYHRSEEWLESPVFDISAEYLSAAALSEKDQLTASDIGNYRIVRELGRGGMGKVYEAVRSDGEFHQQVAIKLISFDRNFDFISRRFRQERQILANLNHPNIARLIDGGTTTAGLPYLVMEYVEGIPIDIYADREALTTNQKLELFRSVCSAVEYAHQNLIIHRDLKPTNILVTSNGTPKLLDFGIAKVLKPEVCSEETSQTTALFAMTPEYSSPEQVRGQPITERTDVYSLGIVLYKLLTDRLPYILKGHGIDEVARIISTIEPEKPSTAVYSGNRTNSETSDVMSDLHDRKTPTKIYNLSKMLSGDLDNIVLMALRKEPERRYASVADFATDLDRYLKGLPVVARADTVRYRATKFFERNKTVTVSSLTAALVCLLLGVSLTLFAMHKRTINSIAVLPFLNASGDGTMEYLSDGITDNLVDSFSNLPQLKVPARNAVFGYKGRTIDAQSAGRTLGVEAVLMGSITADGDRILILTKLFDSSNGQTTWSKQYSGRSVDIQAMEQQIAQDVSSRLGLRFDAENRPQFQTRGTTNSEAYNLYLKGMYNWSKRNFVQINKAIEYFQQAIELDPNYAPAYSGLANCHSLIGAYDTSHPNLSFPRAKAAALKSLEIDPTLPEGHNSLALITWLYDWDFPGAEKEFKRAIELNPNYTLAHHWYGLFLGEMGRADESIAEEKRALELDPVSPYITSDLGKVYYWARRYDESLEAYNKAGEMGPPLGDYGVNRLILLEQMERVNDLAAMMSDESLRQALLNGGMKAYWQKKFEISSNYGGMYEAAVAARAGKFDRCFKYLEVAYQQHDHTLTQLRVSPEYDGMRSDPRFKELLHRMKLDDEQ